ncbi:hypothetical protein KI387_034551, partial [Taxus chinensis]
TDSQVHPGLNLDLGGAVHIHYPQTLAEAVEKAYIAEETRGRRNSLDTEFGAISSRCMM